MDMNQPQVHMCSPSRIPLPPPSLSHPLGSSQCTSPEHPVSCIKPGLQSASHTIIYTFQRYPIKSSHPHLLPQSLKNCSLRLCLFCCLTYRVIITIFLNSIYILYWCFSFWLTSLCIIGSSVIHLIRTDSHAFFNGWIIFHYVYVPQLSYPFFYWWTSRLLPCPSYFK